MEYRELAHTGVRVPALSLGSYHTYDRMSHEELVEFVRAAVAAGVTWFDLGHYVSSSDPEAPVSTTDVRFAAAREAAGLAREDFFHTQKLWYGGRHLPFARQLEFALPRARVDHADCVIYNPGAAYDSGERIDMEAIVREMAGLVERGLTRFWGINQAFPEEIDHACAYAADNGLPLPVLLQEPYNVIQRRMVEQPAKEQVAERWDLSIQPSNVLAVGVLAGRAAAEAERPLGPEAMNAHSASVRESFASLADSLGATPAQLALAFVLANGRVVSALFGASSVAQLRENVGALDLLERLGADGVREACADVPQNPHELDVPLSSTSS